MPRRKDTDELRLRDRVVSVAPIKDIPEGTTGMVKMVVGQAWVRYLVEWDDRRWTGTVDGSKIVRADRLELYRRRRVEAEAAAAQKAIAAASAPVAAEAAAPAGGDSRVPQHLLERSRQARARAEAKAS